MAVQPRQWGSASFEKGKIFLSAQYWVCLALIYALALLIANVFLTDGWTGDKPFREYDEQDWGLFVLFLLMEGSIGFLMVYVAAKCAKMVARMNQQIASCCKTCHAPLAPDECLAAEWFDFTGIQRATVTRRNIFLRLDVFHCKTGEWQVVAAGNAFASIAEIREALFYEYDFWCEENASTYNKGEVAFKEQEEQ